MLEIQGTGFSSNAARSRKAARTIVRLFFVFWRVFSNRQPQKCAVVAAIHRFKRIGRSRPGWLFYKGTRLGRVSYTEIAPEGYKQNKRRRASTDRWWGLLHGPYPPNLAVPKHLAGGPLSFDFFLRFFSREEGFVRFLFCCC